MYLYPAAQSITLKVTSSDTNSYGSVRSDRLNAIASKAGVLSLVVGLEIVYHQVTQSVRESEVVVPERVRCHVSL